MMRWVFVALCLLSVEHNARAQQVTFWRVDEGTDNHRSEVALQVSRSTPDVMVAWHHHTVTSQGTLNRVWYNVSTDGINFGSNPGPIPRQLGNTSTDPMVAFASDGRGWVGSFANAFSPGFFWVALKQPGSPTTETAVQVADLPDVDKGVLAAGPLNGGQDELGLVHAGRSNFNDPYRLRGMVGPPSAGFAVCADAGGNVGGPNSAIVLRNPAYFGQWVVAYHFAVPHQFPNPPNPLQARATYRNASGWHNSTNPLFAAHPGGSGTELIGWFNDTIIPPEGPYVLNTPSLAADPTDDSRQYMAFLGRTASTGPNDIDLFIAYSADGGANFAGAVQGQQVLHLTDAQLGDPPGAVQFMPCIAVASTGQVGVFYYVATSDGANFWQYKLKLVVLQPFSLPLQPNPSLWTLDITPVWGMGDAATLYLKNDRVFFGDYCMAHSRGCELWFGFVSRHEHTVSVGTYVCQVNLCVDADSDNDGALTAADPPLFASRFASGDFRADLNRNSQLDAGDVTRFLQSYSCQCNP